MSERNDFDANIIGFIGDDFDITAQGFTGVELYYLEPNRQTLAALHPEVFRAINMSVLRRRDDEAGPAEKYFKLVLSLHDKKVLDVISRGRVRMALLENSTGGSGLLAKGLCNGLNMVDRNGGIASTYGAGLVASASTHIWSEPPHKYVLDDTLSVWHTHTPREDEDDIGREMMEDERRSLIRFFEYYASEPFKRRIVQVLREDTTAQPEVRLLGRQLAEAGIATQSFSTLDEMRDHVLVPMGLVVGNQIIFEPARKFFDEARKDLDEFTVKRRASALSI
ncbi:hypothetical protein A2344_00080 [Candidatus Peregrinibacteria bacterium RIFOXYB12_FULL_41_12]|nr:MAG: hypothetical protein A2344_00080 [Candidatus Peregrinibacteria bacterium RIFOXYB12_FULL_41_12]